MYVLCVLNNIFNKTVSDIVRISTILINKDHSIMNDILKAKYSKSKAKNVECIKIMINKPKWNYETNEKNTSCKKELNKTCKTNTILNQCL